jgi:putative Mg2+ transporter-C (MgtC) family protein
MDVIRVVLDLNESLVWLMKLLLAAVLGAAIGFEREAHGQAAGLRTNVMIGLGSCLLMMLSVDLHNMFEGMDASSTLRIDPGRIASYAVAGMGFLGAGAIIKGKGSVRGLTTASGLWLVTGIGLSVGAGYFLPAVFTTACALLILYNMRHVKTYLSHDVYKMLSITCLDSESALGAIERTMAEFNGIEVLFINYSHDVETETTQYQLRLRCKESVQWKKVVDRIFQEVEGLRAISWEESDVP